MKTLYTVLSANSSVGYNNSSKRSYDEELSEDTKGECFSNTWHDTHYSRPFPSGYAYMASLLVELVCPGCVAVCPWADEDSLKYTIER